MATNGLSERSASQSGSVHCRNTRKTVCQKVIQAKYIQKIEQNEPRQSLSRAPRYHHAPHPHRAFSMDHTAGHLVLSPATFSLGWRCAQHHLWAVRAACRASPRTPPLHRSLPLDRKPRSLESPQRKNGAWMPPILHQNAQMTSMASPNAASDRSTRARPRSQMQLSPGECNADAAACHSSTRRKANRRTPQIPGSPSNTPCTF